MSNGPSIGILGGMGPHAGFDLAVKITNHTNADHDHDHLPLVLFSKPERIPDRSTFLLDHSQPTPVPALLQLALDLETAGASVIGIPCNTAHSKAILQPLTEELRHAGSTARIVNMIEETVRHIQETLPGVEKVGVLSTTAVYRLRLYGDALQRAGLSPVVPDEKLQRTVVNPTIFDHDFGLKAKAHPVHEKARANLVLAIDRLKEDGADAIILGCTELPLAIPEESIDGIPMIDPTIVLARALIRESYPHKLRPATGYASVNGLPEG